MIEPMYLVSAAYLVIGVSFLSYVTVSKVGEGYSGILWHRVIIAALFWPLFMFYLLVIRE
jgi:hypothetical protein